MADDLPNTEQAIQRAPFTVMMAVSALWQHIILSAIVAALAFVLYTLTLIWDSYIWVAVIAFPIGLCAVIYTTWCVMMLQRAKE